MSYAVVALETNSIHPTVSGTPAVTPGKEALCEIPIPQERGAAAGTTNGSLVPIRTRSTAISRCSRSLLLEVRQQCSRARVPFPACCGRGS
jgi:hypothetical protein